MAELEDILKFMPYKIAELEDILQFPIFHKTFLKFMAYKKYLQ